MDSIFEAYQSTINEVAANVVITKGPSPASKVKSGGWYEGKWAAPSGADEKDVIKAIKALVKDAKNIGLFDGTGMKSKRIDKFFNNNGTWVAK